MECFLYFIIACIVAAGLVDYVFKKTRIYGENEGVRG